MYFYGEGNERQLCVGEIVLIYETLINIYRPHPDKALNWSLFKIRVAYG